MAATTTTCKDILFKVARDAGETVSEFVTSASSTTVFVARGILRDPHTSYKTALTNITGKGIRTVTAWDPQAEQLTVNSAFDTAVAANDLVELMGWDATRRGQMFAAINEAIRQSWGKFGREVMGSTSITLEGETASYALPTDVGELWRVGFLNDDGTYDWRAERDLWRLTGNAGAYSIHFLNNGATFMPSAYEGETLYAWYLSAEPEIDAETDTTYLPMDWFNLASYLYAVKMGPPTGGPDPRADVSAWQARVGQLKEDAQKAQARVLKGRPQRPVKIRYDRRG